MPLRDHFRSPLDDVHSWDELHGMWPAMIVKQLIEVLPEPYFAAPGVHLGTLYEVDVGTYREPNLESDGFDVGNGGVAVATYAPPKPTLTLEPQLPKQDVYEVRIYDSRRKRRLVAAIEIVSPSNKDRPENRELFVGKVASLLQKDVCVSIVDLVSTLHFNLYVELLALLGRSDPQLDATPTHLYAVSLRARKRTRRPSLLDAWFYPMSVSQPLPTLPIWLRFDLRIDLPLETSYEETCRLLHIA